MGQFEVNVEWRGHAQPQGGESRSVWLHHGTVGTDETRSLPPGQWSALRSEVLAGDRAAFEVMLELALAPPPGGWNSDWRDAAWRAARVIWS